VVQFGKEAGQTRDYCVAENATFRAARPDPSLRKKRLLRMTIKLHHYPIPRRVASPKREIGTLYYRQQISPCRYGGSAAATTGLRQTGRCRLSLHAVLPFRYAGGAALFVMPREDYVGLRKSIFLGLVLMMATSLFAGSSIYSFTLPSIDGDPIPLANFKGKVVLLVNVASRCGFTPQYAGLEAVYTKYKDQGFVILGFPANNFGGQEPGTNLEIKTFCSTKYNVTFPIYGKVSVKGPDQTPLYQYLTKEADPSHSGDIKWNFTKFLVDRNGNVVQRFEPAVTPESPEVTSAIEKLLKP